MVEKYLQADVLKGEIKFPFPLSPAIKNDNKK